MAKKKLSKFEEAFKAARKKQGAGGVFTFDGSKYTTDYKSENKKSKGSKSNDFRPEDFKSSIALKSGMKKASERLSNSNIKETNLPKVKVKTPTKKDPVAPKKEVKRTSYEAYGTTLKDVSKMSTEKKEAIVKKNKEEFRGLIDKPQKGTSRKAWEKMTVEQRRKKDLPTSEGAWTAQAILNATAADWEKGIKEFFNIGKNKGGMMKKKKGYSMGGMMPMDQKKINPTTGMAMNKGGMSKKKKGYAKGGVTDMRKTGMFYGGGMASKRGK